MRRSARNVQMRNRRISDLHREHDAENKIEDTGLFKDVRKFIGREKSELTLLKQKLVRLEKIKDKLEEDKLHAPNDPKIALAFTNAVTNYNILDGQIKQKEEDILHEENEAKLNLTYTKQYIKNLDRNRTKLDAMKIREAADSPEHKKADQLLSHYKDLKQRLVVYRVYDDTGKLLEGKDRPITPHDKEYYDTLINAQEEVVDAHKQLQDSVNRLTQLRMVQNVPKEVKDAVKDEIEEARLLITDLEDYVKLLKRLQISIEINEKIIEPKPSFLFSNNNEATSNAYFKMKKSPEYNQSLLAAKYEIIIERRKLLSIRLLGGVRRAEGKDSGAYKRSIDAAISSIEDAENEYKGLQEMDMKIHKVSLFKRFYDLVLNTATITPQIVATTMKGLFEKQYRDHENDPD